MMSASNNINIDSDSTHLLKVACNDEDAFIRIVREDSKNIPVSVRMFLADQIRNACVELGATPATKRITEALNTVGV